MTQRDSPTTPADNSSAPSEWPRHRILRADRAAVFLIPAVTTVAFASAVGHGFVWDDHQVLLLNEAYRGVDLEHMRWMFTAAHAGHYHPLTWLSFAIDWLVWGGLNAAGFHFTNLLLHVATALGFFFVSRRLLAAACADANRLDTLIGATVAALFFAVHPLRVESVAWVTERRDVLSGALLMLTVVLYLRSTGATGGRRRGLLALSLLMYVLSLLSKASGITLPAVLLLLDAYPLRRLGPSSNASDRGKVTSLLLEKIAFLVPAVIVGFLALEAQAASGALRTMSEHATGLRVAQAFYGIIFYVWKTAWPTALIPLYEQDPSATAWDPPYVLAVVGTAALTVVFWRARRRAPFLLDAWVVYIVVLSPMLGLAQSGPQVVADRYSYLACMPWAIVAGGAVAGIRRRCERRTTRAATMAATGAIIFVLVFLTRRQTTVWANDLTLWSHVIEHAPKTGTAHANLASELNRHGDYEKARRHAQQALKILPGNRRGHLALADASVALDDPVTAETHYAQALAIRPDDPPTLLKLAAVTARLGRFEDAAALYRVAIDAMPTAPAPYFGLASLLAGRGEHRAAKGMFERVIELDPAYPQAHFRLGVVLLRLDNPAAAVTTFETGLQHHPDDPALMAKLAWVLATCKEPALRDGDRALRLAEAAVQADGAGLLANEALAAALATTGDLDRAAATLRDYLASQGDALIPSERARLAAQLARYEGGEPVRE